MFGKDEIINKNRIIDGEFVVDRYITVSIDGQVHSRKVKEDSKGIYIEFEGKAYTIEDFEE